MAQSYDEKMFEKTKDLKEKQATPPHRDPQEFPSSEDVTGNAGRGVDVPKKDEEASDSERSPDELHGSLHGRWNATDGE